MVEEVSAQKSYYLEASIKHNGNIVQESIKQNLVSCFV